MMDESLSSCRIEPRMSVCLKGSAKNFGEIGCNHGRSGPRFVSLLDKEDGGRVGSGISRLSKSSVPNPISSSPSDDILKNIEKVRAQCDGVRFSDTFQVRNHIHVSEITREEKIAAWFRRPEYQAIFKNNTKIINNIGKRERDHKRMVAKHKREEKKKKKKNRNSFTSFSEDSSVDGSVATFNTDDGRDDEAVLMKHILGLRVDDEQGYSVRGLENETAKRRKTRNHLYLKAKYAVLSIQEDVEEHMCMMQEEYEQKLATIKNKKAKKKSRRFSKLQITTPEEEEDVSEATIKIAEALRAEFSTYASEQYHCMISKIAKDYGGVCKNAAKDALERGLQDEKTVRAIEWIESEGFESYTASIQSSGKMSDAPPDAHDKRRPSITSTASTEVSAASLSLKIKESKGMRLGRMPRPKISLWKFK